MSEDTIQSEVKAKDIFKDFRENSVAEFFKKNRQMLGYSGAIKSLTTAVHEYVTNSLDACEESGILPEIFVQLDRMGPEHIKLIVEDNGPGIPKKFVGKVFATMLAGTKFHRFQQARGQQGIGGTGVVMFGQTTTGKPTKVITSQGNGIIYETLVSINVKTNQPELRDEREYSGQMRGTRVETELKGVKYQHSDKSPDEYLRRTALANPHTKITYIDPDGQTTVYDKSVNVIPKLPKPTQPHPKGIEVDDLLTYARNTKARTTKSFLTTEFTRMSSQKAKEIEDKVTFDMNKRPQDMKWEEAEQVVNAIKNITFIAPPTDCLIPIDEEQIKKSLENILKPEFYTMWTRPAALFRGGVPFIIEVALAYGGEAGKSIQNGNPDTEGEKGANATETKIELMRFANRVPLLFDSGGCAITKAVNSVDWKRYEIKADNPITILINFTSIHVPYTGTGKESIAEEDEIIKEIRLALMDTGRRLGKYVSGQKRESELEQKKQTLMIYSQPTAEALSKLTGAAEKTIFTNLKKLIESKYEQLDKEFDEEEEKDKPEEAVEVESGDGE